MRYGENYLIDNKEYHDLLKQLKFRKIVEFGVGNGELTNIILETGPEYVIGYEILDNLNFPEHEKFELKIEDFTKADLSFLDSTWQIVCHPPYQYIYDILDLIIKYGIKDILIMVPEKLREYMLSERYIEIFKFSGNNFSPPANGNHFVFIRGHFS